MKRLISLFCLFTLLTAFTCENEPLDSDVQTNVTNPNPDINLIGTWDLVEFSTTLGNTMEFAGQTIVSDLDITGTEYNYTLEFTENSYTTNGSYSYVASVLFDGVEMSSEPYTLESVSGNYSIDGNEMTVDGQFFEFSYEGEVDSSAFEGEQTATYELSDDGQTLTFVQDEVIVTEDSTTGTVVTSNVSGTSVWQRQ
ncbi:hypothetical protein [Winogradskyella sp. SYSU M77433]|uniref:hypothetical protein n=1 Tax=Winogradskyella sp. SYSU M77433 TaxID=3042722 RepID=UPI0024811EBC|nr:hypothetical protein [Winogradskyella sp. SYSU M77433]MDH7913784.1 hypothetical protein [Winogradskyella sp. SYSU M77433]